MERKALLKRLVDTNGMLLHHLEEHILGMMGNGSRCQPHEEEMIRKYVLGLKEVHNGLECFLVFNQSQELQNVLHGMNLKIPGIDFETSSMTYQTMSKYPNLISQQEIQETMVIPSSQVKEQMECSPTAQVIEALPPPPPSNVENKKRKRRRSKKDVMPPLLDMKKIKEQEVAVMEGNLPPFPEVPPTPCNETFNVEQFFQSLTEN